MIELIDRLDTALFFIINRDLQNAIFDWFMPFVTNKKNWYPLFLIIIVGLLWKGGKKGRIAVALLIPVIVLSDQLSASLIKPFFDRMRPCEAMRDLEMVNMLIGLKTSPSFPSSHAANSFAAATFFGHYYPRFKWLYFAIATIIAYSRVYVGVHYPLDVIAGALLGVGCAFAVYFTYDSLAKRNARIAS